MPEEESKSENIEQNTKNNEYDGIENLDRFNLSQDSTGNLYYLSVDDTRKPSLTLKHLSKLRKMRAVRRLEMIKRQRTLELMYGSSGNDEGDSGGMGGMGL